MERSPEQIAEDLMKSLTVDYKAPMSQTQADGQYDMRFYQNIDRMCRHPVIKECMRVHDSGLANAEFEIEQASSSGVGAWAEKAISRFWEQDLHQVQVAKRYGWLGSEIIYAEEAGTLCQAGLRIFHPTHTKPLTYKHQYAGLRVSNLSEQGERDLRCAGRWPGKAFWHTHEALFNTFYGVSQLYEAHRDWQRLAEQRGAEEILYTATVRSGVPGPLMRFPEELLIRRLPNGELDKQSARNEARELIENWQAGMALLFSSKTDDKGNYLWDAKWPEHALDATPLLDIMNKYEDRLCYAIGTPKELLQSIETGGYAGRNITMETFLATQMRQGRQILKSWFYQIGLPLCRFHFGPDAHFRLKLKPLAESRAQQQGQPGQPQPGDPRQAVGNSPAVQRVTSLPPKLLATRLIKTRQITREAA